MCNSSSKPCPILPLKYTPILMPKWKPVVQKVCSSDLFAITPNGSGVQSMFAITRNGSGVIII